ncbi:MAG: C13 family peptidase [Casimicrobiaceae bacterium]
MRPTMLPVLRDLVRNIAIGARLAFGLPVTRLGFRIGVPQLLALFAFEALIGFAVDWAERDPGAVFTMQGFVGEAFYGALLMLFSALLSRAFRQPGYLLALPVVVLASQWPLQIARAALAATVGDRLSVFGAELPSDWIVTLWTMFWLWRAAAVSLAPRRPHFWPRSLAAAAVLISPLWLFAPLLPDTAWWATPSDTEAVDSRYPSPASEEALAAQPKLLDDTLADLEDQRPGAIDLYFVGFAPDATEDVFRKDVVAARDLFDERFDTEGRSVALINSPRTVLDVPLATVNNLRETLSEIGGAIDRDEDVVLLYLESHGSRDYRLTADFPPLELDELSPQMLHDMLDEAGIKWRIIIVSACYSGGYIRPLEDEYTLIMTASAADRTSFGCGTDSDATFFGEALFRQALHFEDSFVKAFEQARRSIAEREKKEKVSPPSDPQLFVGTAMAAKLPKLEAALRERRAGGNI